MKLLISVIFMKSENTFSYRSFTSECKVYPSNKEIIKQVQAEDPKASDIAVMGISKMTDKEYKNFVSND